MKRAMKPVHPGAILREDVLKPYNLTITEAAQGLQVSRKQLSEIINEKASITAEMAIRFEQGFKIAAYFWLDLQRDFDLWKVQQSGKIHLKPLTKLRVAKNVA
jgi:addiction module HigA family antidote